MDFENLRAFIAQAEIFPKAKLKADKRKKYDAIFLYNKPEELEADTFLVYSFNQLDGEKIVKHYAVDLQICGKDVPTVLAAKDSLIELLNFNNRPCEITNIIKFVFSNEGGIFLNENTGLYIDHLYFDCKLL